MYAELYGEGVPAELFSVPMKIHMLSNDGGNEGQVKKKHVSRPDFYNKESGRIF